MAECVKCRQVIDYKVYRMSRREKTQYTVLAAVALFLIGWVFFNHVLIAVPLAGGALLFPGWKSRELTQKRQVELNLQFKDLLFSLSSSLGAGRSPENAFRAALRDLRVLYPDDDTLIIREVAYIGRRIELNDPLEAVLAEFAGRSGLEDVQNFADVITICKRTGGNMVEVVKNSAAIIGEKIEIRQDIELLLARQRFEQKILNLMPFVFIGLVRFGGAGYMDALYSSVRGYLLMALALVIIGAANLYAGKIFDIRV